MFVWLNTTETPKLQNDEDRIALGKFTPQLSPLVAPGTLEPRGTLATIECSFYTRGSTPGDGAGQGKMMRSASACLPTGRLFHGNDRTVFESSRICWKDSGCGRKTHARPHQGQGVDYADAAYEIRQCSRRPEHHASGTRLPSSWSSAEKDN